MCYEQVPRISKLSYKKKLSSKLSGSSIIAIVIKTFVLNF